MSIEFFLVSLALAIIPGTGVVFTLACALSHGIRGAVWGAVAGAVGVIPHVLAAGAGLSAMLIAFPLLYDVLRVLGGCYLLWLALQAWRHRAVRIDVGKVSATGAAVVTQGAMINLLNPKLTLFFVSFLPQFLAADDPAPGVTMVLMGVVLIGQTFFVFLAYGAVAAAFGNAVKARPRVMTFFRDSIAVLFAGLGVRVLFGAR